MLSLNPWDLLWTVVNLLFLYAVLKKFLLKPVMNIIHTREEMINGQFDAARKEQEAATEMKQEYKEKLEHAQVRAEEIIVAGKQRVAEERAQMIQETQMETTQMVARAKAEIEGEREKAQYEVQAEVAKLAVIAARKIMKAGDFHDANSSE